MKQANLIGLKTVQRKLNKAVKIIEGKTLKGLIRGGLIVLRDVEKTSPKTPVDLSNLRASRFLVTSNSKIAMGSSPTFTGSRSKAGRMQKERNPLALMSNHQSVLSAAKGIASSKVNPTVILGFSAKYAAHVHEMIGDVNWQRPGSGAKFFEKAVDRNILDIVKMVRKEAKFK